MTSRNVRAFISHGLGTDMLQFFLVYRHKIMQHPKHVPVIKQKMPILIK